VRWQITFKSIETDPVEKDAVVVLLVMPFMNVLELSPEPLPANLANKFNTLMPFIPETVYYPNRPCETG
jgi:hypothetical protein